MENESLHIVKIGGNVLDDLQMLQNFLKDFQCITGNKILVHGGGKYATQLSEKNGVSTRMVDGRRITDEQTLDIVTMVYAGLINKKLVAQLQSLKVNAMGMSGCDANLILARKRKPASVDFGFVGDLMDDSVNTDFLCEVIQKNIVPVVTPLTHDGTGQLLNTNADTIASALASALSTRYRVNLCYCFEKKGVLKSLDDDESVIHFLSERDYINLKAEGIIHRGMLPKLDNSFKALNRGVHEVWVGHAQEFLQHMNQNKHAGTTLVG